MRWVTGWVAGAAVLLSGCVITDFGPSDRYQTDFHYTFDLHPDGRLDVEMSNGSIEIAGWDQDKVEITGVKFASTEEMRDAIRIETRNDPGAVSVRANLPSGRMGNMGARCTLHVPRGATLDRITTSNSSIRVRDVASAAHLKSSNGDIRVENVTGHVEARTSNSAIDLDSVRGGATMKTSNGAIRAENIEGALEAETSNSSINVRCDGAAGGPLRLSTSNGSITLSLTKSPKSDVRAGTNNSRITLHLPADTDARVSAQTSNSSISSDFPELKGDGSEGGKSYRRGTLGKGGPSIDLNTSNGNIRIVRGNAE